MTQPDLHPDADALNAFAEHALPDAERARVLAHMAGCGRCREIVYLAQAAAEPEIAPAAEAVNPEPRQGWFSAFTKWRMALIPAAALATVGAVVLWVQVQHATKPMEMARLAQPSVRPVPQVVPAAPANASQQALQASQSLAVTAAPPAIPKAAQAGQISANDAKRAAPPAMGINALTASSMTSPEERQRATQSIHLDAHSAAMAQYAPPPISPSAASKLTPPRAALPYQTAPQQDDRAQAANKPSSADTAHFNAAVRAPAPIPPNTAAVHGVLAPSAAGVPAETAAQSESTPDLASPPSNGFALMRLTRKAKLPSGLDSVSSAALLNRLVAIDSAGSVFSSQDGGQHWETVKPQWTGKAVTVHSPPPAIHPVLATATSPRSKSTPPPAEIPAASNPEENSNAVSLPPPPAAPNSAADSSAAADSVAATNNAPSTTSSAPAAGKATARSKPPEMIFKLVTDRHEVWVSVDGKEWARVIAP